MAPKKAHAKKRQSKLRFSPAEQSNSHKRNRIIIDSDSSEEATLSGCSNRKKLEKRPAKRHRTDGIGSDDAIVISSKSSSSKENEPQVLVIESRKSKEPSESEGQSEDKIVLHKTRRQKGRNTRRAVNVSDDEEQKPRSKKGRKQKKSTNLAEDSDEDETGEDEAPIRRSHRLKNQRKPSPDTASDEGSGDGDKNSDSYDEEEELQEELDFLRSSPPPDRGRLRSTQKKPKSQRQKALEALKKRRGGTAEPPSATPSRRRPLVIETDSDIELDVVQEELENEVSDEDECTGSEGESDNDEPDMNAYSVFLENAEDEDFIDDENALIGEPGDLDAAIPLEMSRLSSAKARDLFQYAIDWMVNKKLHPAFDANDPLYKLTFRKLNDEVSHLANSKYSSSVWRPEFTRAIRARPDLILTPIGKELMRELEPHCQACNRKAHVASWEASLKGVPYHADSLEPVSDSESSAESQSNSSDSSVDSNGQKPTYNATGEHLPSESRVFALGSHCKQNAQTAHTLYHWKYHLNSWVVEYLEREGYCTPQKLFQRDKWTNKKREKYAVKVVKKMKEEGEIDTLYHLYKAQVQSALETNNNSFWRSGLNARDE